MKARCSHVVFKFTGSSYKIVKELCALCTKNYSARYLNRVRVSLVAVLYFLCEYKNVT